MVQGELFREENINGLNNINGIKPRSFLACHQLALTLDKLLIVAIGMVVVFALTFSFGVERGKRAMEKRLASLFPTRSEILPREPVKEEPTSNSDHGTVLLVKDETSELQTTETAAEVLKAAEGSSLINSDAAPTKESSSSTELVKQGKYTIQLVTYKDAKMAEREATRLKSNGHDSFVIPSGSYFQVCANFAETHSKAKLLLKQLRETGRYPDAFIRPVAR